MIDFLKGCEYYLSMKIESNEIMERVSNDVMKLFEILKDDKVSDLEKGSIENWFENMKEKF